MGAIFKIEADPVTNLVRHYLAGFFEAADVERYVAARDAAHAKLTCGPHAHVTLVDVRDMKIQPQEIVQAFGAVLANPRYRSRASSLSGRAKGAAPGSSPISRKPRRGCWQLRAR
jgi:hypothetical protein